MIRSDPIQPDPYRLGISQSDEVGLVWVEKPDPTQAMHTSM